MKKTLLALVIFFGFGTAVMAQAPLSVGERQVNFGLGFNSAGIPVYGGVDFGVYQDITAGGQIGLDLGFNYLAVDVRGDYHFNRIFEIISTFDAYAGLDLGVDFGIDSDYDSGVQLGIHVGGRYFWNNEWAINLEFGGGTRLSGGRAGVTKLF